ncbi:phosphorylase b kinase regulatory subunit alpha, liver isoform-like isoform X1 [Liolophura sinensis]|uniref:phosphorylase b kinase regulatory subunit alpha, liver isoform-like isoform X1 n=1 Tax=Liolophura sinensis TaxID=3198878 RepID=UPI0031590BBC
MLPRESSSKEVDASLLGIISFPAFAVDDPDLIDLTRKTIQEKLQGSYGCCRFLRDGYKTVLEDASRQHYEPGELAVFENIECEWPLFFAYFTLDGIFSGKKEQTQEYMETLEELMVKTDDVLPLVPELYRVPKHKVELEKKNPGSQKREPIGQIPHKWSQSLYIVSKLLIEGFLSPGEIDPLNRRLNSEPRPDVVVQVVILAESVLIQNKLAEHDILVETIQDVSPIQVYPAKALSQLYSYLGKNKKLGLTGRPSNEVGLLATSKLYMMDDQLFAFMPQYVDQNKFYLPLDTDFFLDTFKTNTDFLCSNWTMLGRPTMIFPAISSMLDPKENLHPALIATIKKLQTGYISGTRVQMGNMSDFKTTSCITNLDFIRDPEDHNQGVGVHQVINLIDGTLSPTCPRPHLQTHSKKGRQRRASGRSASVSGMVKRTRSIQINPGEAAEIRSIVQARLDRSGTGQARYMAFQYSRSTSRMSSRSSSQHSTVSEHEEIEAGYSSGGSCPVSPNSSGSSGDFHLSHLKPGSAADQSISPFESPSTSPHIHRKPPGMSQSESDFNTADFRDLIETLEKTESLHEQADILHCLFINKGLDWDTEIGGKKGCTVRDLLVELYEKAGHWKQWWLVRHTAGMLRKRVEDLALAAADLLVRQKQLSVGLPPEPREKIITRPLPPDELASIIFDAYGEDVSTATLTQEILIYLAMFIRTEPKLFNEMLRLRVGLIIQVMASELARTLKCTGDEASDHLLNLSPFEMKTLLHHILSGKEFLIHNETETEDEYRLSVRACEQLKNEGENFANRLSRSYKVIHTDSIPLDLGHTLEEDSAEEETEEKQGQWLRRRRLDGSLNRTPVGFYKGVWKVLQRCPELYIEGHSLNQALTREMTPGELKFALQVEMVLNRIPQPEYRQLNVEALMIIALMVENDQNNKLRLPHTIHVDHLVREANALFLEDQHMPANVAKTLEGAAKICLHFYDSAPSGRFGTLSYLCRALAKSLHLPMGNDDSLECVLS